MIGVAAQPRAARLALEQLSISLRWRCLPLTIPVLILGVSAAEAGSGGTVPFYAPFVILCAITLAALALCFVAAAALRYLGE
ncbi:heme exporter protein CcmB [Methylocystis sp.]|uniref:heme exporter protein CcmB n=1 Tax=Methylocystis sp. TaxID=1911079 RepID=UPI003DA5E5DD